MWDGIRPAADPTLSPSEDVTEAEVRAAIEHTLLAATARAEDIAALCAEARAHGFGAVCVNPVHVARCRAALAPGTVRVVSVVGFPLGANTPRGKAFEAAQAVADGADELDVVMALGAARSGDWAAVETDLAAVVQAAAGKPVKVILETGVLDDPAKEHACRIAFRAGAAFVKTCTGFGPGAATVEDVRLMRRAVAGQIGVKASGGIRTAAQARALLAAGASRLGTSAGVQIVAEFAAR